MRGFSCARRPRVAQALNGATDECGVGRRPIVKTRTRLRISLCYMRAAVATNAGRTRCERALQDSARARRYCPQTLKGAIAGGAIEGVCPGSRLDNPLSPRQLLLTSAPLAAAVLQAISPQSYALPVHSSPLLFRQATPSASAHSDALAALSLLHFRQAIPSASARSDALAASSLLLFMHATPSASARSYALAASSLLLFMHATPSASARFDALAASSLLHFRQVTPLASARSDALAALSLLHLRQATPLASARSDALAASSLLHFRQATPSASARSDALEALPFAVTGSLCRHRHALSAARYDVAAREPLSLSPLLQASTIQPQILFKAIIFLFVEQAAIETVEPVFEEAGIKQLEFLTKEDDVIAGRKPDEDGGTPFNLWASLYADDGALPFTSRVDLELGARLLKKHLLRFALVMHCDTMNSTDGTVAKKSKTEAMFYQPAGYSPTTNDTLFLKIDDALGIVMFTDRFCQIHTSTSLPLASKGKLYRCLVLGVLLYGCESWPLRASFSDHIFKYAALAPQYVALGLTDID
ncbi:hypothetical protein T492DRAFT_918094, partial [Pavlovales sp. CCMP2436]